MAFPALLGDDDLKRRVARYLDHRSAAHLTDLQVEAHDGVIVLQGSVSSLYEKELCRHVCTRVAGVIRVVDETVVTAANAPLPELARVPR